MIFWDNFDTRTTKVLCDECHSKIPQPSIDALKAKPSWWRLFWPGVQPHTEYLDSLQKQWVFRWGKRKWVLMKFREVSRNPDTHLRTLV